MTVYRFGQDPSQPHSGDPLALSNPDNWLIKNVFGNWVAAHTVPSIGDTVQSATDITGSLKLNRFIGISDPDYSNAGTLLAGLVEATYVNSIAVGFGSQSAEIRSDTYDYAVAGLNGVVRASEVNFATVRGGKIYADSITNVALEGPTSNQSALEAVYCSNGLISVKGNLENKLTSSLGSVNFTFVDVRGKVIADDVLSTGSVGMINIIRGGLLSVTSYNVGSTPGLHNELHIQNDGRLGGRLLVQEFNTEDTDITIQGKKSQILFDGILTLGDTRATSLRISDAATQTFDEIIVGKNAKGHGNIQVDDTDSRLNVLGNMQLGVEGSGRLGIIGGTVDVQGNLIFANKTNDLASNIQIFSHGTLSVHGFQTTLTSGDGILGPPIEFQVPVLEMKFGSFASFQTLSIKGRKALVDIQDASHLTVLEQLVIGDDAGDAALLRLGGGSVLDWSGMVLVSGLIVGNEGKGELRVEDGSIARGTTNPGGGELIIGKGAQGGLVTVTGQGTQLSAHSLRIGNDALPASSGVLKVLDGAQVQIFQEYGFDAEGADIKLFHASIEVDETSRLIAGNVFEDNGLNNSIFGFNTDMSFDLEGNGTISAKTMEFWGGVRASGGLLDLEGKVSQLVAFIEPGATLEVDQVGSGHFLFSGPNGTLKLTNPQEFGFDRRWCPIALGDGDTIELVDTYLSSAPTLSGKHQTSPSHTVWLNPILVLTTSAGEILKYELEGIYKDPLFSVTEVGVNTRITLGSGHQSRWSEGHIAKEDLESLLGNDGADVLVDNNFAVTMAGQAGGDVYKVRSKSSTVLEEVNEGHDRIHTDLASFTLPNNVEDLIFAGDRSFVGRGNSVANVIIGGVGTDKLLGLAGKDTLSGGPGADSLFGGPGKDIFDFREITDSGVAASARDQINGFQVGDRIDVSAIDANVVRAGSQAFKLDQGGSFAPGEIRQVVSGNDLFVKFNIDGDVAPEMIVSIIGSTTLLPEAAFIF